MKEFIIILLVSAILCIVLGRPLYNEFKEDCGVNIEQAILSGGLVYDR